MCECLKGSISKGVFSLLCELDSIMSLSGTLQCFSLNYFVFIIKVSFPVYFHPNYLLHYYILCEHLNINSFHMCRHLGCKLQSHILFSLIIFIFQLFCQQRSIQSRLLFFQWLCIYVRVGL